MQDLKHGKLSTSGMCLLLPSLFMSGTAKFCQTHHFPKVENTFSRVFKDELSKTNYPANPQDLYQTTTNTAPANPALQHSQRPYSSQPKSGNNSRVQQPRTQGQNTACSATRGTLLTVTRNAVLVHATARAHLQTCLREAQHKGPHAVRH